MTDNRYRGLQAVLRNALTWGIAWAVAGGGVVAVLSLFAPGPGAVSLAERLGMTIVSGLAWGVRFGLAGSVIGTVFSSAIRFGYRGRRLTEISPVRFAMLGAVVAGVGVPLFLQMMNVLSGDGPVAWNLVTDDAAWATLFGTAAAGGSILLARRSEVLPQGPSRGQLEYLNDLDGLSSADQRDPSISPRSRDSASGRQAANLL
jgi:hypothetical protein